MCKFWKKEKCNHHFPELTNKIRSSGMLRKINRKTSAILTAFAVFVLGFLYLTQTNLTATKGYQIKILEKQLAALTEENQKLNLDYVSLQSMDNVKREAENLKLVPTIDSESLSLKDAVMALR